MKRGLESKFSAIAQFSYDTILKKWKCIPETLIFGIFFMSVIHSRGNKVRN